MKKEKSSQKHQESPFDWFSSPNRTVEENIINLHVMSERILEIGACIILLLVSFFSAVLDIYNSVVIVSIIICFCVFIFLNLSLDVYWETMKTLFILWSLWIFYSILWYKTEHTDPSTTITQIIFTLFVYGFILFYIMVEFISLMKNQKTFDRSRASKIYITLIVVLSLNVIPFDNNIIFMNPMFTGIKFTLMSVVFFILRHSFDPTTSSHDNQDLEFICRFIQIDYIVFGHLYVVAPLSLLHIMIVIWTRK